MQTNILNPDPEKILKSIIITQELPTGVLVNMRQLKFFFFQSLPYHLADTVEDVKNQPHGR